MEIINIYGDNCYDQHTKVREACRGIVVNAGKILLTCEVNREQYFIPGGGLEARESLEACCVRELAEETGCVVDPLYRYLTISEYYEEWLFVNHYFLCEITGQTGRSLTEREAEAGLEPCWIPLEEAISLFSRHQEYTEDEMKRGAYLREYRALSAYQNAGNGLYELAKNGGRSAEGTES